MAELDKRYARPDTAARAGAEYDEGLRSYMMGVYNYMAAGVALTGIVAYLMFQIAITNDPSQAVAQMGNGMMLTSFGATVYSSPIIYLLIFSPLAFIFFLNPYKRSVGVAQMMFWAFAAVMGLSMSTIFLRYTGTSITQVFFITATAFGALSLWGYTTKKNLSGWGSFLIMGVVGVIIAMVVNIFLQSSALQFAISIIGLLAFAGLTAYDTQRLKSQYYAVAGTDIVVQSAIAGALSLYLDFVNMFQFLLMLFGSRE